VSTGLLFYPANIDMNVDAARYKRALRKHCGLGERAVAGRVPGGEAHPLFAGGVEWDSVRVIGERGEVRG
jgi:hypothetical protein